MLFSYKFEKLLKSSFFTGHLWWLLLYFNNFSFLCSMKSFIKNKCQKLQWNLISMKTKLSKINLTKMFYHRTFFSLNFLKKKRITNFVLCYENILKSEVHTLTVSKNFEKFKIFIFSHKRLTGNDDNFFFHFQQLICYSTLHKKEAFHSGFLQ